MTHIMASALDPVRTLRGGELADFFASVDAVALVQAVTASTDDDLLDLLGSDAVRAAAVPGILARLDEYAVPARLAEVRGVVRFDLERRGRLLESHAVRFTGTGIEVCRDAPDVVLTTSLIRFVRLVSGQRNAGLEYLAGDLRIQGDALLALAVGGLFVVPGSDAVAVDPTALDPVEVAIAVGRAEGAHLRSVMAGGFRAVVLGEIFRRLPEFVNARKARDTHVVVALRLTGGPGGRGAEPERYVVRLEGPVATVVTPADPDPGWTRDATITLDGADFLRLATGHLSAITGVLRGQLKVAGDKAKALAFAGVIDFPRAPR